MRILILGGGVMQLPAVRLAKEQGWDVVVAAAAIMEPIRELADRCEAVDLRDMEAVARAAAGLSTAGGLDGVFTAGTDFSTTAAWVAEKLGLPGIPYQAARRATDKALMREAFRTAGVPSPEFFTVDAAEAGKPAGLPRTGLPAGFRFPLVVKPVDNMGARGVRRVEDEGQLSEALELALENSACGRAIVEPYLDGPELSLDALIHGGAVRVCGVADRHIRFPPWFVEMGHTIPSNLDPALIREAEQVFERGIRALGISQGAAKGDIKITEEGLVIGEIAARLSGGYMSGWTYPLSSGVEPTAAALRIAVGLPPGDLRPKRDWVSAERALISIPGTVRELQGREQALAQNGIAELFVRVVPGQSVGLPIDNMGKCGNLISAAADRVEAVEAAEKALRCLLVRLQAQDPRTDAFLRGEEQGRYSAFSDLSRQTHDRVKRLPPWIGDPERFSGRPEDLKLLPLPGVEGEGSRDWHGFTLERALERSAEATGVGVEDVEPRAAPGTLILGRIFWNALIRGGVQAGVYLIDSLCSPASLPKNPMRRWMR